MNFFLDTEFYEAPGVLDLISIGIVDDEGAEFYAVSNEFYRDRAWLDSWVRENVLRPIFEDMLEELRKDPDLISLFPIDPYGTGQEFNVTNFNYLIEYFGQSRQDIAADVRRFCLDDSRGNDPISFYGYYANYDWVLFCWLFGRMVDLPKRFPMFCMDLKQMMVDRGLSSEWKDEFVPDPAGEHNALKDAAWNKKLFDTIILRDEMN